MKKKRCLGFFLTIILLLGMIVPVLAISPSMVVEKVISEEIIKDSDKAIENEAKVSKDEAIKIGKIKSKELFDYQIDDKKFSSRIQFREDYGMSQEYMWDISWSMNNNEKSIHINVWISGDTGELRRISKREYIHNQDSSSIAKITQEEAAELAERFVKRVNPNEYKEIQFLDENYMYMYGGYGDTNYRFRYNRMADDIIYDSNYIHIEIDGIKGEVTSYEYKWDKDIDFPSHSEVIDDKKAEEILRKNMDVYLIYIPHRDRYGYDNRVNGVRLVYNPKFSSGYLLDANNGKMIDPSGNIISKEKIKDISEERKNIILKKAKEFNNPNKEMEQDKATKLMKEYIKELYGDTYEIENIRYMEDENYYESNGKKSWGGSFQKQESGIRMDEGGNITIDAVNGQLLSVYRHIYRIEDEEKFEPVVTWEEGYDKAIDAIEKYFPDKIGDVETELKYIKSTHYVNGKEVQEREFNYQFGRIVNGIQYRDNYISISIDTKTGRFLNIRYAWGENVEFPGKEGVISKKDAEDIYFESYKPELAYTRINKNNDHKNPNWETKLVYRLRPIQNIAGNIDALTGKFLDYNGKEIEEVTNKFEEKIKGHKDGKKLSILASQGIINPAEFELHKEITLEEAINMLVDIKGYKPYLTGEVEELKFSNVRKEDSNYRYLQLAIQYGILDNENVEFSGQEKISREKLAQMIIQLLEYNKLGKMKDIFKLPFDDADDVDEDKIGYVAICKGLGIMEDQNGEFRPKDNATMVETAAAIYNALADLRR